CQTWLEGLAGRGSACQNGGALRARSRSRWRRGICATSGRPMKPLRLLLAVLAIASLALPLAAYADSYPDRPVRLIVPAAAGGSPDQLGRLLAQKLSDSLGQQVFVDHRH